MYYTISHSKLQEQLTKNNRHAFQHDGYQASAVFYDSFPYLQLVFFCAEADFSLIGPVSQASVLTKSSSTAPGATIGSTRSLCSTTASIRKFFPCLRALASAAVNSAQVVTVAPSAPQALAKPTKLNGVRIVEE